MWKILILCLVVYINSYVRARHCPKGWIERGDPQCYLVVNAAKTFVSANGYCKEKGANLASVHGKVEMKFLDRYLKSKSYWIGLNDRRKENAFAWTDGTKVDYTNWGKNQPDNFKNEDCVELDKKAMGYVFNDNKCTKLLPFVCKMKAPGFYPLKVKLLGKLPNAPGQKKYSLPSSVPADAKKVLLFATSHSKYNPGHNLVAKYMFYTKQGKYNLAKYMSIYLFAHLHTTSNSQNIWLPVTTERAVRVKYTGPKAKGHLFGKLYVIGYKA